MLLSLFCTGMVSATYSNNNNNHNNNVEREKESRYAEMLIIGEHVKGFMGVLYRILTTSL